MKKPVTVIKLYTHLNTVIHMKVGQRNVYQVQNVHEISNKQLLRITKEK